ARRSPAPPSGLTRAPPGRGGAVYPGAARRPAPHEPGRPANPTDGSEAMALEQELNETLTRAIRDKDQRTADVVRMIKTRITERRTAKGFAGQVDDALVREVIGAYRKQLQKALVEFEKLGDRGAAQAAQLRFEIEFCGRYLPQGMDEAVLRALVEERRRALGLTDAKQAGRLAGGGLYSHKGQDDAGGGNRLPEESVAGTGAH